MNEALALSRPLALFGLLLLPAYAFLRHRVLRSEAVPFAPLQHRPPSQGSRLLARLRIPLELTLLAVLIVGLAGLHRVTTLELFEDEGVDVMLVLDVSLSMLAEDFPPSRIEALQRIARDFVRSSGGHRIGTVIFARDSFVQTPLTTDHRSLLQLLDSVSVYAINQTLSGGTALGDALLVATEHLSRSRIEGRDQALILITDGASNLGGDPLLAAGYVRHQDIRLYAVGVGSEEPVEVFFEGSPVGGDESPYLAFLDDTQLREVAERADGRYYRATEVGALESIFAELSRLESAPLETRVLETRRFVTEYFALAALALFAAWVWLTGVAVRRPFR